MRRWHFSLRGWTSRSQEQVIDEALLGTSLLTASPFLSASGGHKSRSRHGRLSRPCACCRSVGESARGGDEVNQLHLSVNAEPDPRFMFQFGGRFMFQFGGEPEFSSQVF
jgi:hypothetical protein